MTVNFEQKIAPAAELKSAAQRLARPIVMTNGVFDILHRGHVTYLSRARGLGASLVVAVNSDQSVRQLDKGPERPINGQHDRAALLAALDSVSLVTIFEDRIPLRALEIIKPDFYVKGSDYDMSLVPEADLVKSWGGQSIAIRFEHQRSTTALLRKLGLAS